MKKLLSIVAVSVFALSANAGTLDDVKNRGFLKCGVTTGLAGFAAPDDSGNWTGLDVDMCRAVAAAVFGRGVLVVCLAFFTHECVAAASRRCSKSALEMKPRLAARTRCGCVRPGTLVL